MSASTEKKLRQAARQAGTDKKTLALEKEAEEKAKQKRRWTLGTVAVFLLIALILLLNSNLLFKLPALTVGDETYSASEVNYYYANQYYYWANQYGSYASIFGLDTSSGIKGLADQTCIIAGDGMSWKDYFLESAQNELLQEKAMRDYAAQNGIVLTQEELDAVESNFDGIDDYAREQGYASADKFFAANYGTGVSTNMVRTAYRNSSLATKALSAYSETLTYSDEELDAQYASYNGDYDYFDLAYYYVAGEQTDVTDENGETSQEVTDEALAAAKETAEAIQIAYNKGSGEDFAARLDQAVATQVADAAATRASNTQGANLIAAYKDWAMDAGRKAGDITVTVDSSDNGYYVVAFIARENNDYSLAQVRHILVKAEADADGNYTQEAKDVALAKAQEILAEYESGDRTEDNFAALAEQYSEDTGSNASGGLYDSVFKGQMVAEFDAFCFAGHNSGDTAIVYGESSSYAGYHVMYYVGEGDNYARTIARNDLINQDVSQWLTERSADYTATTGFGMRFVG